MALADFLAAPDNLLGLPPRPAYGGYQFDLPPVATQQPTPQMPTAHGPSKLRNFLGALGDALMVGGGGQPLYRQRMEQQRQQSALQGFLTNPDQAIAQLMQVDAPDAINLYKAVHPASEVPAALKEWQAYQTLPDDQKSAFIKFRQALSPQILSPVTLGANDTVEQPGGGDSGSSGPPQAAVDYLKAHPDLAPEFDQKYGAGSSASILGGPTGKPSGNFPVTARNNNPGALRVPGSMRFQSFASPQEGVRAQEALLRRYFTRGLNNVSRIVETYAPRKSRGGDNTDEQVNNYIGYVARRLGVNPADSLSPALLPRLAQAMREFETGQRAY